MSDLPFLGCHPSSRPAVLIDFSQHRAAATIIRHDGHAQPRALPRAPVSDTERRRGLDHAARVTGAASALAIYFVSMLVLATTETVFKLLEREVLWFRHYSNAQIFSRSVMEESMAGGGRTVDRKNSAARCDLSSYYFIGLLDLRCI